MKKKNKVIKKTTSKKAVGKKSAVKKAVVKKPVKVKPAIKYTWDIKSIDAYDHPDKGKDLINQIVYEVTGNITENSITRSASTMGAIAVHYDTKNLFSTVDYKQFSKKELLDYVQKQVADRHLEAIIDIISQELSPEKKTVTEFSWNK